VGHRLFDRRQGRNQTSTRPATWSPRCRWGCLVTSFPIAASFLRVRAGVPDHPQPARLRPMRSTTAGAGREGSDEDGKPLNRTRCSRIGRCSFPRLRGDVHFANAAMLPLLANAGQGQGRNSMMFMSACVVTTQLVVTLLASWAGRKAGRGAESRCCSSHSDPAGPRCSLHAHPQQGELVAIQVLDGWRRPYSALSRSS